MLQNKVTIVCMIGLFFAYECGEQDAQEAYGEGTPRFVFSPQPAGRAVGIRAIAELPSGDFVTNEFEIELLPSESTTDDTSSSTENDGGIEEVVDSITQALNQGETTREDTSEIGVSRQALCAVEESYTPVDVETRGGMCWLVSSIGFGALVVNQAFNYQLTFADKGDVYKQTSLSNAVYLPPNMSLGYTMSVGCMRTPENIWPNTEQTLGISLSYSLGVFSIVKNALAPGYPTGFTILVNRKDYRILPAVQYDSTFGMSASLIPGLGNFSVTIGEDTAIKFGPVLIAKKDCSERSEITASVSSMPSDDEDYMEDTDAVISEAVDPLMDEVMKPMGEPPGPYVSAGSNGDAFASLGNGGLDKRCQGCPVSSADELLEQAKRTITRSKSGADLMAAAPTLLQQLPNVMPSPETLDILLRRAHAGLQLADDLYYQRAHNGVDVFVGSGVIKIEADVGIPFDFTIEAQEIADLMHRPVSDVLGATLEIEGEPHVSASTFVLEGQALQLTFTPSNTEPIVIHTTVDLTTAEGSFPGAEDFFVSLTPRMVTPKSGPPTQATISGPSRVASGGSVSLNTVIRDADGNPVDEPTHVRFEDGLGNPLGETVTRYGVATFQYVPSASEPVLSNAYQTTLTYEDGSEIDGIVIEGIGLSVDVEIYANGMLLDPEGVVRQYESSNEILVATFLDVNTAIYVINPGGQRSNEVLVTAK